MPCDLKNSFKSGCNSILGIKILSSVLNSTIWTALLIVMLLFIITFAIIPTKRDLDPQIYVKYMFYSFLVVISVLFLHNNLVQEAIKSEYEEQVPSHIEDAFEVRRQGGEDTIPVIPKIGGGNNEKNGGDSISAGDIYGAYGIE